MTTITAANTAIEIGAGILLNHGLKVTSGEVKGERDYVTEIDKHIEKAVRDALAKITPDIPFLGEEFGGRNPHNGLCWVLDPIDGTVNFMRGSPLCGISLALLEDGVAQIGIIDFPFLKERFSAQQGSGATLNGIKLPGPQGRLTHEAVVGVGDFATGPDSSLRNAATMKLMDKLASQVLRVRMLGTAAAQLAWLAAGRLDISITLSNKPWDVQAGILIAKESGCEIFDITGDAHSIDARCTLAAHSSLKPFVLTSLHQSFNV